MRKNLEIRLTGDPFATVARTPGEDYELTVGLLFCEGLIESLADLGRVTHCGRPGGESYGHVVDVMPGPGTAFDPERQLPTRPVRQLETGASVSLATLAACTSGLVEVDAGSAHVALALDTKGSMLASASDTHADSAVNKVIGKLVYADKLAREHEGARILVVRAEIDAELVQRAARARIAVVVSTSAATRAAVERAEALGITLARVVHPGECLVLTSKERVQP
jgi:FdhD protein